MKKLTLLQETKTNTIDINDHIFEVLISDDEVFSLPREFAESIGKLDINNPDSVDECVGFINGLYDRVLGEGALHIISGGKPVPIAKKIEWFREIFSAISATYFEQLEKKYE